MPKGLTDRTCFYQPWQSWLKEDLIDAAVVGCLEALLSLKVEHWGVLKVGSLFVIYIHLTCKVSIEIYPRELLDKLLMQTKDTEVNPTFGFLHPSASTSCGTVNAIDFL